jgi:hypothetical protein
MLKVLLLVLVAFATLGVAQERRPVKDTVTISPAKLSLVFITRDGKKYHREACQYLNNSKASITLQEATERGYKPCKRCYRGTTTN